MKDHEFDDLVKNRVRRHESPVPADMWERITGKEKKRRAGLYLRLFFPLLILLLVGIPVIYFMGNKNNPSTKNVLAEKAGKDITANQKNKSKHGGVENVSPAEPAIIRQNEIETIIDARQKNTKTSKQRLLKRQKERKEAYQNIPQSVNSPANDGLSDNKKVIDQSKLSPDSAANKTVKEPKTEKPDSLNSAEAKADEPVNEKFFLELYASPDMPVNGISSGNKSYEQVLKSAGSMQLSYSFGARIGYQITEKLSAKIGVQYTRVNEKISFSDSQGKIINSSNRYKNVSIPLLISYTAAGTDNLHMSVSTGMILHIVSRYKGIIPSVSGQAVDIRSGNVYDKNVSASLYVGFDISKRFSRRTDFFAEPRFTYRLKNMVSHYYSFNQRIHSSGLSVGLRYHLFKKQSHQF